MHAQAQLSRRLMAALQARHPGMLYPHDDEYEQSHPDFFRANINWFEVVSDGPFTQSVYRSMPQLQQIGETLVESLAHAGIEAELIESRQGRPRLQVSLLREKLAEKITLLEPARTGSAKTQPPQNSRRER